MRFNFRKFPQVTSGAKLTKYICTFLALVFVTSFKAQKWSLMIKSNVELRTWKLTSKPDREEKALGGAAIKLYKGSTLVSETTSQSNGDFSVLVPPNGEFVLTVSYTGCNPKKFSIPTTGVPDDMAIESYKPTFSIGGFIMAKALPGIDYSGLQQSLLRVEFKKRDKKFDNDETETERGKKTVSKIFEAEDILVEKFCTANREGDAALLKPDCPLAKACYERAISLIPGEKYPVDQLPKVGKCLKDAEEAAKKAAEQAKLDKEKADKKAIEDALAKAAADKAAQELAEKDKLMKAQAEEAKKKEADEKKAAEEQKLAELKKAAEEKEKRIAEEKKAAEDKRLAEEQKAAEEKKLAEEKKIAEANKKAEEKKAAEEQRLADEKKAAEDKEKRIAEEKKAVEEKRLAAEQKAADENKLAEEKKIAEANKKAEEKKAADEQKLADEKKAAEDKEKRLAEENKAVEEKRLANEKKAAEDKKLADEKKLAEDNEKRLVDEKKLADEKKIAEEKLADQKKAENLKPEEKIVAPDNTKVVVDVPPVEEPKKNGIIIPKEKNAKQIEADKRRAGMAKSRAEDQAIIDAQMEKEYARREEQEKARKAAEEAAKKEEGYMGKGNADYSTPLPMDVDKYRPTVARADEYVKMKRYEEAKKLYEEALKYKPDDVIVTNKLIELAKLMAKDK